MLSILLTLFFVEDCASVLLVSQYNDYIPAAGVANEHHLHPLVKHHGSCQYLWIVNKSPFTSFSPVWQPIKVQTNFLKAIPQHFREMSPTSMSLPHGFRVAFPLVGLDGKITFISGSAALLRIDFSGLFRAIPCNRLPSNP
jgi:hypothetical protein